MLTSPRIPFRFSLSTISGIITAGIGLAIIVSWHLRAASLLQLQSSLPPPQYNTAIGLVLCGSALALATLGWVRVARITGLLAALLGLLTISQDLFSIDLGIDRLLHEPFLVADTGATGRMAPQVALALLVSGLVIAAATWQWSARWRSVSLAIVGSLVGSLSIVALGGYLTGFEQVAGWGNFGQMAVQSALAFLVLGVGILARGWATDQKRAGQTPRWLFAPVMIAIGTASVLFAQALFNNEGVQIELASTAEAAAVQQEVASELAASVAVIDRIAIRWEKNGRPAQSRWQDDVGLYFDRPILFQSIGWVDQFYQSRWVVPASTDVSELGFNFRAIPALQQMFDTAREQRQIMISPPVDRGRDIQEIIVARPVYVGGAFDGFIIGIYRVDDLFSKILNERVSPASSVVVTINEQDVFSRTAAGSNTGARWQTDTPVSVENLDLTLQVWPSSTDGQQSLLPYVALVLGFIVAWQFGLVTWLFQQAGERTRTVQRVNDILESEIVERHRAEHELQRSADALERSNRSLQEFAYVASHDLKAPLVSLQGLATMLQADIGDSVDDEARLYLERIVVNAGRMRNLLDDLLELSRAGRDDIAVSPVDLTVVIDSVTDQQRQTLDARGAQVVAGELPMVMGNPTRIHQVFANLIDNAIKYTPEERLPVIQITATETESAWQIDVQDNGAGIPAEYHEKVFTMFQRLPKGRTMNPSGSGMGLAIVSRIVEANGGRCWIDTSDDQGTRLCMTFPKVAPAQPQHAPNALQSVAVA